MSNSPLVDYTRISPNKTSPRNHAIDTITIHCVVGQCSVQTLGNVFAHTSRQASCNYGIGFDGKIGMYVEEKDRSWCSSNIPNDDRAITIEVASDTKHPYKVNDKAYTALIDLLVDICKRNEIKELVWSTKKSDRVNHRNGCNMTVHRDYANKACPGDYLYNRHGEIAAQVNRRLQDASHETGIVQHPTVAAAPPYPVQVRIANLHIRKGPGINYGSNGFIKPGVYTIVAESTGAGAARWGKLKSGAGWISLDFANLI